MLPLLRRLPLLCGLLLIGSCQGDRVRSRPPNVVFVYVDDLGWSDLGYSGSRYHESPFIDQLAAEGMVFTSAYSSGPNCSPSRACLMSGQDAPRHGIYTVSPSARGDAHKRRLLPVETRSSLEPEVITLAEALRDAGYVCGHFGKWHLGDGDRGPLEQGFDVNVGGNRRGAPASYFSPYRNPDILDGPDGESLTERLTDEACEFIERNRDRPFFAYLSHYAVHTPMQARPEEVAAFAGKPPDRGQHDPRYAAMLATVDRGVGRILATLKRWQLERRTLVILTSDNGGHGGVTSNRPLRGSKGMLYEGGIRVPMVVRWPGVVPAGQTCDVPVIGTDFYPTLLELAGTTARAQALDGSSLAALFRNAKGTLARDALYWHFPAYLEGRQEGSRDPDFRTRPAGAVRRGDWKLIESFEDGALELYDLADDPGESRNLAAQEPERCAQLLAQLRDWRERTGAPMPDQPNPEFPGPPDDGASGPEDLDPARSAADDGGLRP